MTTKYVLEWSKKSNVFHIQPLESLLATNQTAFIYDKSTPDYIVLMVGDKQAVHEMADHWRDRLKQRSDGPAGRTPTVLRMAADALGVA